MSKAQLILQGIQVTWCVVLMALPVWMFGWFRRKVPPGVISSTAWLVYGSVCAATVIGFGTAAIGYAAYKSQVPTWFTRCEEPAMVALAAASFVMMFLGFGRGRLRRS